MARNHLSIGGKCFSCWLLSLFPLLWPILQHCISLSLALYCWLCSFFVFRRDRLLSINFSTPRFIMLKYDFINFCIWFSSFSVRLNLLSPRVRFIVSSRTAIYNWLLSHNSVLDLENLENYKQRSNDLERVHILELYCIFYGINVWSWSTDVLDWNIHTRSKWGWPSPLNSFSCYLHYWRFTFLRIYSIDPKELFLGP